MHELTKNLKLKRQNDLSINSWRKLFNSVKDKCENIINIILLKINESLSKELEDETIKYISCLYNIYSQNKSCPPEICLKLKQLKKKTKVKKIIFKIMDILDLNE